MLIFYSWMFLDRQGENAGLFGVSGGIKLKHFLMLSFFCSVPLVSERGGSIVQPSIFCPFLPTALPCSACLSSKHRRVKRQRVKTSVLSEQYDWL